MRATHGGGVERAATALRAGVSRGRAPVFGRQWWIGELLGEGGVPGVGRGSTASVLGRCCGAEQRTRTSPARAALCRLRARAHLLQLCVVEGLGQTG